jgi:hypothetical protein
VKINQFYTAVTDNFSIMLIPLFERGVFLLLCTISFNN